MRITAMTDAIIISALLAITMATAMVTLKAVATTIMGIAAALAMGMGMGMGIAAARVTLRGIAAAAPSAAAQRINTAGLRIAETCEDRPLIIRDILLIRAALPPRP